MRFPWWPASCCRVSEASSAGALPRGVGEGRRGEAGLRVSLPMSKSSWQTIKMSCAEGMRIQTGQMAAPGQPAQGCDHNPFWHWLCLLCPCGCKTCAKAPLLLALPGQGWEKLDATSPGNPNSYTASRHPHQNESAPQGPRDKIYSQGLDRNGDTRRPELAVFLTPCL